MVTMSSQHGLIPTGFYASLILTILATSHPGLLSVTAAAVPVNTVSDTCGNVVVTAGHEPNYITSPGYPDYFYYYDYGNSLDCTWTVVANDACNVIQITIHSLTLEGRYDYLTIYDGKTEYNPVLAKPAGYQVPKSVTSSGNSVLIEFRTDSTEKSFRLSYIQKKAIPFLSESVAVTVSDLAAAISVDFISCHSTVYWSRNDVMIQEDSKHTVTVTPANVTIGRQHNVAVDGFTVTLTITTPEARDFGLYRMTVRNTNGIAERLVILQRATSVPVVLNVTVSSHDATIMVKFSSDPQFKPDDKNKNGIEIEATYTSLLRYWNPIGADYVEHMCIVRNEFGITEIFIDMEFPETELPKLLTSSVQVSDQHILLSVNFDSNFAYPTVTWYHNNTQLWTSDKYDAELKWKDIPSQDWLSHGYPPVVRGREFQRVVTTDDHQPNVSVSYKHPVIGGGRSSTQTNAKYTAILTITNLTQEDFGIYRVVLENFAGKSDHIIDVTGPEVFFSHVCDQTDTVYLVCHVTSCSVTQSWIHSIDGKVIRNPQGHQNETTNTLTIPACMYSDAGTHTCVATEEETGRDVAIHHNSTTVTVRAVPVLLPAIVAIPSDRIQIEVPFYSHPPHSQVTWQRNGDPIISRQGELISVEPHDVNLPMHGKEYQQAGHVTKLLIPGPTAEKFGTYTITIENEMGKSEIFTVAQNPDYVEPVISHDVSVSYDGSSAFLKVNFTTYHPSLSVKWYFKCDEVRENRPVNKYAIQTDPSGDVTEPLPVVRVLKTTRSTLTVMSLSEEDYGKYDVLVSNKAGQAMMSVTLYKQEADMPAVVGEMTTSIPNSTAEISASFYSSPSYRLIRWLKEDNEISDDLVRYSIVNEDNDIKISFNGEILEKPGTTTRLSMTSLEDQDYGLYTVQIYNDVGMTERSVTLEQECP